MTDTTKKQNIPAVKSRKPRKPRTKKTKEVKLASNLGKLKHPAEYMEFITFMAIPRVLRVETLGIEDDTQEAFRKKHKLNKDTLVEWKKRAGFWDDVQSVRKDFFRERSGDVILALETTCIKDGKGQDVRVYLTYTGEYSEKLEQEHKVHPELQAALEKIGKVLS